MTFVNPLDLQTLLMNNLAGSSVAFAGLAIITIAVLAARFRMNNWTMWILMGLFAGFMSQWMPALWFVAIFAGMVGVGFMIAKIVKN